MPQKFTRCKENGGRIRTISGPSKQFKLEKGEYRHVCWLGNEPYWGNKHKSKEQQHAAGVKISPRANTGE